MTAIFYSMTSMPEEINKTLGTGTTITGVRLLPGQDVTTPQIEMESASTPTYNYVKIQALNRWYFIDRWIFEGGQVWSAQLNVDVLGSFYSKLDDAYGTMDYSAFGSPAIIDRRMTFTDCPTVARNSKSISNTWYYAIKYWSNGDEQPHVALMTDTSYRQLISAIGSIASDSRRTLAYSCLIDVSIAYHVAIQTTATSSTTMMLWQTSFLEAGETVVTLTIASGFYDIPTGDVVNSTIQCVDYDVSTAGMTTSSGDFWDINAKWSIMIPHAGVMTFSPGDFGLTTVTSTTIRVFYEPYEGAYVMVPILNSVAYYSAMIVTPVNTHTILPTDTRFDNLQGMATATALSVGGTVISSIASIAGGVATSNPALIGVGASSAANAVAQTVNGVNDYRAAKAAAAVAGSSIGAAGGSASWVDANLKLYIWTQKVTATLRGSASTFRSRWGLPDGQVRAASDMESYGYFKFGDVELENTTGMTQPEVNMMKSLLTSGVHWAP